MTEALQVGQFAIVDYEPVERGPNAGNFTGRGPAGDRAELWVLAEGTTPAGESFAGHIVSGVGHAWESLDMSLTGAIRRVFRDAGTSILDWNEKSIAQHRVSLGMICFARRGSQAVIAQAGPSVAFLRTATGETETYFVDEEHGRPLGSGPWSEPQLTRVPFGRGDRLLLISTNILRGLDDELIGGILALPAGQVLGDLYRRVQELRNATVVFIAAEGEGKKNTNLPAPDDIIIDATGGALPPPKPLHEGDDEHPGFQPSLFIDERVTADAARRTLVDVRARELAAGAAPLPPLRVEEVPALRRASGDNGMLSGMAPDRRSRASMAAETAWQGGAASRPVPGSGRPQPGDVIPGDSRRSPRRSASFSRGLVTEERPPLPASVLDDAPLVNDLADEVRARPAVIGPVSDTIATDNASALSNGGSLVRVRGNMSGRWKGNGTLSGRGYAVGKLPPTWLIIAAGLGLLVLVVGVIAVPRMLEGSEGDDYVELVDSALTNLALAEAVGDPGEQRALLRDAQASLLKAQELPDAGDDTASYLQRVKDAIAGMDAVVAVTEVVDLADLSQFGEKPLAITHLVIGDQLAYMLDSASGQVLGVGLETGEVQVVYAANAEAQQARPAAVAWTGADDVGAPSALIVDADRQLWAYSVTLGLRAVPLAVGQSVSVTDIATAGSDLYVLDAGGAAIWRLLPGEGGYLSPVKVVEAPEVGAARRLMVDEGEIVTVAADGSMRRYAGQLQLDLSQSGIDTPLVSSEPPVAMTPGGEIGIADPPNSRIVVLRRDGAFDRQYQHEGLEELGAFTVSGDFGYVFSGGKLRRLTW